VATEWLGQAVDVGKVRGGLAAKERQVKLTNELDAARKRISKALHLDAWMGVLGNRWAARETPTPDWVIVYRTAQGFCCIYHDVPVEFSEMLDVQIWAEEMDVQTYFLGL
jgi:hypothetical protein